MDELSSSVLDVPLDTVDEIAAALKRFLAADVWQHDGGLDAGQAELRERVPGPRLVNS